MARGEDLTIELGGAGWEFPMHPIGDFRFWLIEGQPGQVFAPTGYKTYRRFEPSLPTEVLSVGAPFGGEHVRLAPGNSRSTPGILWGDLHGMAFNQRPLDDYYEYAREVADFDFAAAMLFSYNVCVGDMWDHVKETAARFTQPGEFVAVPGIEFGTPPDISHRNAHFFLHPERVPPIFCEERPPALEPRLTDRFHTDTVMCRDLEHFYETVAAYGGMVSGHFHTLRYEREHLAEMWQKQTGSAQEEERVFGLLNQGMRLGLVGGSDTHDSMPGNPGPEPSCPQTAGFMAVLADEVTPQALYEAVMERRVYATTGARVALRVDASGHTMGSAVPADTPRAFRVEAEGSAPLAAVELVRQGAVVDRVDPSGAAWEGALADPGDGIDASGPVREAGLAGQGVDGMRAGTAWYLVRVTQTDGHRAWSSPIWFG